MRCWPPKWRPLAGPNPYAPPPDPEAEAQADAALRRDRLDARMSGAEVDALMGEMELLSL